MMHFRWLAVSLFVGTLLSTGGCMQEISREERVYPLTVNPDRPVRPTVRRSPLSASARQQAQSQAKAQPKSQNPWWKPAWLWGEDKPEPKTPTVNRPAVPTRAPQPAAPPAPAANPSPPPPGS